MKSLFPALIVCILMIYACGPDDDLITDSGAQLEFSTDTLTFDTVFTALGSATRILKIYNPHSQRISIDKIDMARGSSSKFRLNVDGIPGLSFENVEIPPEDSIYIFTEVTVDPDQDISSSPYVIFEDLVFETNGNSQKVVLEAWGQNANYIPNQFNNGGDYVLPCAGGTAVWDDEKPYVIFGILVIDNCVLTVKEGTDIYVHGGLESFFNQDSLRVFYNDGRIITTSTGTMRIEGTYENPVTIQGDRLEEGFDDQWGQWFGIVLTAGSKNNLFNYTTVKNAVIGVAVDSTAVLETNYSVFHNTTASGILGINAEITANNCLVYNNGGGGVTFLEGGTYDFNYCTIASYGVDADALGMSDILCLDQPFCEQFYVGDLNANFKNCIITGSRADEIALAKRVDNSQFNYQFENCIVKLDDVLTMGDYTDFLDHCPNCINMVSSDPLFFDTSDDDYHLDTLSIAEEMAIPIMSLVRDLDNTNRDMLTPDIGCYEYVFE
mgnify:CR=1 FL=1